MLVRIEGDEVEEVQFKIFEPPRFFEALLRGRQFTEAPDITARICGICPIAYIASSCDAMEDVCGVELPEQVRLLRRLVYCGEWIESHVLHTAMLHAPDFLGYDGAVEMARDHRDLVERALRLKKAGNTIMDVVGGRAVHPVNLRVGGFYRAPTRAELAAARAGARVGPRRGGRVHALGGRLRLPRLRAGLRVRGAPPAGRVPDRARPDRLEHGARHRRLGVRGALHRDARRALERAALDARGRRQLPRRPARALRAQLGRALAARREIAAEVGLGDVVRNPFRSIVVRAVETVYAADEALRIIAQYEPPEPPFVEAVPRAGTGHGCTEAPRGICWHRYEIDDAGTILDAKIVPPTSQNQKTIEEDLVGVVKASLHLSDDELGHRCEQTIRNYDPCISCATHFLRLEVERA